MSNYCEIALQRFLNIFSFFLYELNRSRKFVKPLFTSVLCLGNTMRYFYYSFNIIQLQEYNYSVESLTSHSADATRSARQRSTSWRPEALFSSRRLPQLAKMVHEFDWKWTTRKNIFSHECFRSKTRLYTGEIRQFKNGEFHHEISKNLCVNERAANFMVSSPL